MADVVPLALRALSFIAALAAAGVPLFLALYGDDLERARRPIEKLGARVALAGLVLALAYQLVEPARLAGALRGVIDVPLQAMLIASDVGTATAVRVLGLALLVPGSLAPNRATHTAALVGTTLIAASFAFIGHTASDEQRWLLAVLLIVHLLVVAYWFGALVPLYLASKHESIATTGKVVERFSRHATRLVPAIFVAGLAISLALLPDIASLVTPYGSLLLTKVAGFSILIAIAALNKWRLAPLIAAGNLGAVVSFRRSVSAEWVLIAAVVSVTAVMTGLFSPEH